MDEQAYMTSQYRRRIARIPKYACLSIAGICTLLFPSDLVAQEMNSWGAILWSICLTGSALACLYSPITDKWIGEFTALPLLCISTFVYGVAALAAAKPGAYPLIAYGLFIMAFTFSLLARWQDVRDIKRASEGAVEKR